MSRHWVLGEFASSDALVAALKDLRAKGFEQLDAHTPFPVEETFEALGLKRSKLPLLALGAGLGGAGFAYVAQWFANAVDYPLDVGGRPLHSVPMNLPITFELGVLSAALTVFGALMVLFGFPHVTHPVFDVESFRSASVDGFWASVAVDAEDAPKVEAALRELGARQVSVVAEGAR
ncbi:DUF3341 domain-containing protein [Corallococcus carmarthensis]|uniref:DUF3341 domain-containing protein n=1 Tax=Corallococcus carmarthensis TaxID=2316728 RepID=A0A3A8KH15_9BACT|nr:DUF3341 domain-containing protein [Corallococcus carmarthensis]NOK23598.1 DUF3341 domain-containing protein [Corallococcus carmarthensis]RKH01184.1 DUF3341 domain-containing protein [Corallococcus carmarthensis]